VARVIAVNPFFMRCWKSEGCSTLAAEAKEVAPLNLARFVLGMSRLLSSAILCKRRSIEISWNVLSWTTGPALKDTHLWVK
jgi:hypothetical protein